MRNGIEENRRGGEIELIITGLSLLAVLGLAKLIPTPIVMADNNSSGRGSSESQCPSGSIAGPLEVWQGDTDGDNKFDTTFSRQVPCVDALTGIEISLDQ